MKQKALPSLAALKAVHTADVSGSPIEHVLTGALDVGEGVQLAQFTLICGDKETDDIKFVRPDDFHPLTNARVYVRTN